MNITLKNLKDLKSSHCVTIALNTHRTKPDNLADPILLKNLVKEAEQRIAADSSITNANQLVESLKRLETNIDHNYNLESLVLFVNENMAEYLRLPISVENRVILDSSFATRDLVRAMHIESNYYILVLSQQKVRLIEAMNDKVVEEVGTPFPIENDQLYSTSKGELADAGRQTNLVAEFFNRIDKAVNEIRQRNPLPVLICTEEGNYHEYLKIADQKHSILDARLNKNRVDEKDHAIVREAWEVVKEYNAKRNNERMEELEQAVGSGNFLSDINDIWLAIGQGRIRTLFIETGLYHSGILNGGNLELVADDRKNEPEVIDDIYDELIEQNMKFGGDVVFLPKGKLDKFNGFGAITRY